MTAAARAGIWLLLLAALPGGVRAQPAAAAVAHSSGLTELRSHDGELDVTLEAQAGKVQIGDLSVDGATYNGLYAGPVLRVSPGDLLRVRLINHLSQPTNLHFHGIRTSPLGNSDNIHVAVRPGGSFTYEIRIPPDQPPGLYWYHSHLHGQSEWQVMAGLSGALVVESPSPAPAERLFVLKDMIFADDTGNPAIDDELQGIIQSVNGRLDTQEAMPSGSTQLWRFTNQSADRAFHIALPGHRFQIIAEDGAPTVSHRSTDRLDIMPAARVDVLVTAGEPGRYPIISAMTMTGSGAARRPDRILGALTVTPALPPAGPPAPTAGAAQPRDLRALTPNATRTIVFSQDRSLDPARQKFYLNGKTFDIDRIDIRVPLGNLEEWTVRNESDDMHVFHIHQLGFQVVEINGETVPFDGEVDTVRVPERGSVKLRMAFTDRIILGRFVFHCHVLLHEDRGMMAQIEVFDPAGTPLRERLRLAYLHVYWWLHGVPWALCGLAT